MARVGSSRVEEIQRRLPDPARRALARVVSRAERRGLSVYLVGGAVRDLLLGAPQLDVDVVVEGDALGLASSVAAELGARAVLHPRFGTAVLSGVDFRLDLARARSERYAQPGALPFVRPAALADDLARRDFTINAMALRLSGPRAGELVDPFRGRDDLHRRLVRVLHEASFRDDATRILRSLRYAGRFEFALERGTEAWLVRDRSYLETIGGARLRHELERVALEERAGSVVALAQRLGALRAINPALRAGRSALAAAAALPKVPLSHRDAVLLCLLAAEASAEEAEALVARLALTGRQANALRGFRALLQERARLARDGLRPSHVVRLLEARPAASVEALALLEQPSLAADRARRYLDEWRFVRSRLNGGDVEALGVPHGPQVGATLRRLREARLDGRATTREDEVALVRRTLRGSRTADGGHDG